MHFKTLTVLLIYKYKYSTGTHLISLAISSSVSRLFLRMNMRNSTMATSPTMEPSVAAAITPPLEAAKTDHSSLHTDVSHHRVSLCVVLYVQVITSRLMEQLSVPAVLLARQMYFPDMPLVRLLSLRVPCLSSASYRHILMLTCSFTKNQHCANISQCITLSRRSMSAGLTATRVSRETEHR